MVDLEKIRKLRKSRKLTQREMGIRLGYRTALGYHYLEKGKCRIAADQLAQIAGILGVPVSDLYTADGHKTGTENSN